VFVWLQLGVFGFISDCKYYFTDLNGWPISSDQENDLHIVDSLQNTCVRLAWPSDVATNSLAVLQKTLVTSVRLKRSVSMEQYATKRPRSVFSNELFKRFSEQVNGMYDARVKYETAGHQLSVNPVHVVKTDTYFG